MYARTMPTPPAPMAPPPATEAVSGFRAGPPFSLGVEEELLLVDRETHQLLPAPSSLFAEVEIAGGNAGRVSGEVSAAEIELITPVCRDVGETTWVLRRLRHGLRSRGRRALAVGVHPAGVFSDIKAAVGPRYDPVIHELGGLLRTPTAALQVHVGMPDPVSTIHAHNGLRRHLPLLHALAAGSPFWHGRDSRMASARAAILRSYPRSGIPPAFVDYEQFVATVTGLAATAEVPDYTYFWWDVRPHPRLGTIEVRTMDSQWSLARTAALTALVHGLARDAAERPVRTTLSHEALSESLFQASRYGLRARLVDDEGYLRTVPQLASEAVSVARPYLVELGGCDALDGITAILLSGDEAERQRAVHRAGGMPGLLDDLATRTMDVD